MSVVGNAAATPDLKVLKGKIRSLSPYSIDKTLSVEGASADAKATGDELAKRVKTSDIADNLTTETSGKVLSAKQGKVLKNAVDTARTLAEGAKNTAESAVEAAGNAQAKAEEATAAASSAQASVEELMETVTGVEGSVKDTLQTTGGTMTGALNVIEPTEPTHAASKEYVDSLRKIVTATVYATQWLETSAPYTQTIKVDGVTAESNSAPHICLVCSDDPDTAYDEMEAFGCVSKGVTGDGTITFTCFEDKPSIDFILQIEVNR